MIIRRRRLNEAPLFGGVKDKIANIGANLKDKITNVNGVNINDLVAKIIFGPRSINGYSGVLGQNYQAFEKLSDSTK